MPTTLSRINIELNTIKVHARILRAILSPFLFKNYTPSNWTIIKLISQRSDAMLVVISDLHLGDGTTAASIPATAFYLFAKRLRQDAHFASMRFGKYHP